MEPWKPIPVLLHDVAQLIMVAPPTHLDTTFCVEECWGMLRIDHQNISKSITRQNSINSPSPRSRQNDGNLPPPGAGSDGFVMVCQLVCRHREKMGFRIHAWEICLMYFPHPLVLPRDLSHDHTVPDRWLLEFPWVSIFLCMFVVGCSWRENPSNPFALFRTPLESPSDLQLCFSWDRSRSSLHGRQLLQCELLRGAAWGSISTRWFDDDGGYVGEWNLQASFNYFLTWIHGRMFLICWFCWMQWINRYIIDMNPIRVPEFPCLEICRSSIIRSIPGIQKKSLKRFRTHSQRERCSLVKHSLIVSSRNSRISCWLVLIIVDY